MKFETKYKILLWKGYYEKGFSVTSTFKYIFYFLGIAFGFLDNQIYIHYLAYAGGLYLLSCIPIGFLWYKYGWMEAEAEVNNRFNLFQKEVRKFLKKKPLNRKTTP